MKTNSQPKQPFLSYYRERMGSRRNRPALPQALGDGITKILSDSPLHSLTFPFLHCGKRPCRCVRCSDVATGQKPNINNCASNQKTKGPRMKTNRLNAIPECSPLRPKAPEGWRTPKPGGLPSRSGGREASWSAVALYRFSSRECDEALSKVSPAVHPTLAAKAPEDWHSPKPGGLPSRSGGREAS